MRDSIEVQSPYCFAWQELDLDPDTSGSFVQALMWERDEPLISVERAQ